MATWSDSESIFNCSVEEEWTHKTDKESKMQEPGFELLDNFYLEVRREDFDLSDS